MLAMTAPVRWKKLMLAAIMLLGAAVTRTNSAKIESMSMVDDGWRPIVGTQREGPFDEITHYRNPASKKADPVKAEKPTASTSAKLETSSKKAPLNAVQNVASNLSPVAKMPPHSKPVYLLPTIGMHSPQLGPISSMHHHRPIKYSHLMKVHHHAKPPRTKPLRHQMPAFSTRDEVFVPAPSSNVGPYTFYSASQPPHKPPRPSAHIEFANHFPIPHTDDELYQIVRAPVHQYVIPKTPLTNDVHYTFQNPDDYTRNIGGSPYKFESSKEKIKKVKDAPRQEALSAHKVHPFHATTPQPNNQVEVQVTKEKLKVFHNALPSNYNPHEDYEYRPVKSTVPHKPTYEVTEGKWNQETPIYQYHYTAPPKQRLPPPRVITEESKPFLPTPLKPDNIPPTLPTESEISTIYNQVKLNRQKAEFSTPTPVNFFDVKEVSTHFPILGAPDFQTIYPTRYQISDEKENEITTKRYIERPQENYEPETTTPYYATSRPHLRNRRPNRRRRPTSTTTAVEEVEASTDTYEAQKMETIAEVTTQRVRRPSRFRISSTTTPQPEIETTTTQQRYRQRRPRPTTTEAPVAEVPDNHKPDYESLEDKFARLTTTTEKEFPANFESHFTAPFKAEPSTTEDYERSTETYPVKLNKLYTNPPSRDERPVVEDEEDPASVEEISDEKEDKILEDFVAHFPDTKKEPEVVLAPEITINTPENELDFTTRHSFFTTKAPREETTTEYFTTTSTTPSTTTPMTTTPTTTTTTTTTEAPKRIRGRPVKYDSSSRPRFSVKEYRQRITSTTTTTDVPKTQNEVMRIRFPNRSRRPITPAPTTTSTAAAAEEESDTPRIKFQPKDPRHPNADNTTEKLKFNTVNTRIRPFGRFKPTAEPSSTTQRISIKPNIFGNLRRPTPISLKNRILGRQRTNTTTAKPDPTTLDNNPDDNNNETDQTEIVETTIPYSVEESYSNTNTEFDAKKVSSDAITTTTNSDLSDVNIRNDDFMQSQIVSDLTSSLKNEYNKPGVFKNVQPNSRKVPSYFTLATDDPILPIEAFFPNLKDKQR